MVYAVIMCSSLRLSHAGIVSKQLNVELCKQRHIDVNENQGF